MPLERFLQLLDTGSNVLVRPSMWEDPYEKVVAKSVMDIYGERIPFDESRWYGQCWSTCPESDALWRIFTNGKNARSVMIKSTSAAIKNSLKRLKSNNRVFFLEKVKYSRNDGEEGDSLAQTIHYEWMWENNYDIELSRNGMKDDKNIAAAPILLTKRSAFSHEQEVRLLCYNKKEQPKERNIFAYKIPSLSLFLGDKIELDPWTPDGVDETLKTIIDKFIPNNDIQIRKSPLYKEWERGFCFSPYLKDGT